MNTPAWLDAQENWVINGIFLMISDFKEYCYYHPVMQFYGFSGGNDAKVYRHLTGVTISTYAYHIWTYPTFSLQTLDVILTSL